jgi:hypothetical protein
MPNAELLLKEIEGLPPGYVTQHTASPVKKLPDNPYKAIEDLEGFAVKNGSKLTVDRFLEMRHEETEYRANLYPRRMRPHSAS